MPPPAACCGTPALAEPPAPASTSAGGSSPRPAAVVLAALPAGPVRLRGKLLKEGKSKGLLSRTFPTNKRFFDLDDEYLCYYQNSASAEFIPSETYERESVGGGCGGLYDATRAANGSAGARGLWGAGEGGRRGGRGRTHQLADSPDSRVCPPPPKKTQSRRSATLARTHAIRTDLRSVPAGLSAIDYKSDMGCPQHKWPRSPRIAW